MNVLPTTSGNRPRTACEIAPDGVVAARPGEVEGSASTVSRIALRANTLFPGLKLGNIADRLALIAALRRALEAVGARPNARNSEITLIIPDGAARVLLLDFDTLPTKLSEALPIVRFRLKKLLPFEADDAMISYQVMPGSRNLVRVLAVAMPRDVLGEYETVVREAGFEPGAVLTSTLAALSGSPLDEPALLINSSRLGVTTAILQGESLLLHRTADLQTAPAALPANLPAALFDDADGKPAYAQPAGRDSAKAQAVDHATPRPEPGLSAYTDRLAAEEAVQGKDRPAGLAGPSGSAGLSGLNGTHIFGEPQDLHSRSYPPDNTIFVTPTSLRTLSGSEAELASLAAAALHPDPERDPEPDWSFPGADSSSGNPATHGAFPANDLPEEEIAQAVNVAMAYFEDTLARPPQRLWSAGVLPAEAIARLLRRQGLLDATGIEVRELVDNSALSGSATGAGIPRGALAGVLGALRS